MADSKLKRGASDWHKVAGAEGYEVGYFARRHAMSKEDASALIAEVGNNRERLNAAATKVRRK